MGARPLRRTIQREIEDPLSEKILFSELRPGSIVVVDVTETGGAKTFSFTASAKSSVPDIAAPADAAPVGVAVEDSIPDAPSATA